VSSFQTLIIIIIIQSSSRGRAVVVRWPGGPAALEARGVVGQLRGERRRRRRCAAAVVVATDWRERAARASPDQCIISASSAPTGASSAPAHAICWWPGVRLRRCAAVIFGADGCWQATAAAFLQALSRWSRLAAPV